jgi:hypothetical protein
MLSRLLGHPGSGPRPTESGRGRRRHRLTLLVDDILPQRDPVPSTAMNYLHPARTSVNSGSPDVGYREDISHMLHANRRCTGTRAHDANSDNLVAAPNILREAAGLEP